MDGPWDRDFYYISIDLLHIYIYSSYILAIYINICDFRGLSYMKYRDSMGLYGDFGNCYRLSTI